MAAARVRPAAAVATDVLRAATRVGLIGMLAAMAAGCTDPKGELAIPAADATVFQTTVYPILLRDCGFTTCHGTSDRFFSVFGPGRTRLDPETAPYDPATPYELAISYTRARSMILGPAGPTSSLLLRKPIPLASGGAGHKGNDPWGRSVYASIDDARYVALYRWATASRTP